jgi:hypothetical protein
MIFDGIERYITENAQKQTTGRTFHVTMTYFWIQIVHFGIRQTPVQNYSHELKDEIVDQNMGLERKELGPDDFRLYLLVNPYVVDGNLWEDFYSREVIMTLEAKEEMRLPDKKPLPNLVMREIIGKGNRSF